MISVYDAVFWAFCSAAIAYHVCKWIYDYKIMQLHQVNMRNLSNMSILSLTKNVQLSYDYATVAMSNVNDELLCYKIPALVKVDL